MRLAFIIIVSLLGAFLLSAVGSVSEAEAGASIIRFDGGSKVQRLRIPVDKSDTIRLEQPFAEALVGDSEIADIIPLTNKSLYVLGKKIGATRLTILDGEKSVLGIVEIEISYDVVGIRAQIHEALPQARVKVKSANGRIVLSGLVPDAPTLERAVSIAEQFAPKAVVNSISVTTSQQVMLEVRFIETSRNAARDLSINFDTLSKSGRFKAETNFPGGLGLGAFPANRVPFGTLVAQLLTNGATADLVVQALEERGLARRLAEPNLIALSGDTASFLAGGEFPFPVSADNDQITIEFKKFGVGLAFTPTVLANGLINLKIEPEVSEIDPSNTLQVNGTEIPSLITRRTKTTVELRDGQSFAIAGLLQANHAKGIRQLPWIGQVPVLGALFRSASYEKKETELVIIVTPRLVKPAVPGEKLLTPFDKAVASNDVDFFLRGKMEGWKTSIRREKRRRREKAHRGHILDAGNTQGASLGSGTASYKGASYNVNFMREMVKSFKVASAKFATAKTKRKARPKADTITTAALPKKKHKSAAARSSAANAPLHRRKPSAQVKTAAAPAPAKAVRKAHRKTQPVSGTSRRVAAKTTQPAKQVPVTSKSAKKIKVASARATVPSKSASKAKTRNSASVLPWAKKPAATPRPARTAKLGVKSSGSPT
ncbi:MAG: pilus assembly protein N-terminal domain-containing protein, partial [Hyphomicrobium sp.]